MEKLTVTLKTVTPMFLGGVNPNETAELRAPSIKGALRFWYRAIDAKYNERVELAKPDSPTWEEKIFGSVRTGRGCFSIRLKDGSIKGDEEWKHDDYPNKNGVRYLSFSMYMGKNRRKYISPNIDIGVIITFDHPPEGKEKKAILASLWLLGHIGGLGSRSRRGFGTVALQSWGNCEWDECEKLKIAHNAKSADDWWKIFNEGLNTLKMWFPETTTEDYCVFGKNTKFFLFKDGEKSWQDGLDKAGVVMQGFRSHWNVKDKNSDYHRVKAHLGVDPRVNQIPLNNSPERAAFGLPLTFRFKKLDSTWNAKNNIIYENITFIGEIHERSASPIHIRIVKIGNNYYPLYIRFDTPLLGKDRNGNDEKIKDNYGKSYNKPTGKILDIFWNELKKNNNGEEALWK